MRDGARHSHRIIAVRGTPDNPMERREVEAKAHDLMSEILGRRQSEELIEAVADLGKVKNMARLRPLWQAATPRLEHFQAKRTPVRVKKMRRNKS